MTDPIDGLIETENRDHAKAQADQREEREAVQMAIGGAVFFLLWWVMMQG